MNIIPILFSFITLPFLGSGIPIVQAQEIKPLATHEFSLDKRYGNEFVNNVFKDNILLTIDYLRGDKIDPSKINWTEVEKPFTYTLSLKPGDVFAFHDDVLPQYTGKITKTTNAHFNYSDGFKSDGWLTGDGVCHLASLMYWTAKDAGLDALAPTRHDFANIPEVPREYGTAIYEVPGQSGSNQAQNLYITNNKDKEVDLVFNYDGTNLKIQAQEK